MHSNLGKFGISVRSSDAQKRNLKWIRFKNWIWNLLCILCIFFKYSTFLNVGFRFKYYNICNLSKKKDFCFLKKRDSIICIFGVDLVYGYQMHVLPLKYVLPSCRNKTMWPDFGFVFKMLCRFLKDRNRFVSNYPAKSFCIICKCRTT